MANKEHLAILRAGVEIWNQWRRENPEVEPDLYQADLAEADLHGADLSWVKLSEANLRKADLRRANAHKANLHEANLHWAEMAEANLTEAYLGKANLNGVSLLGADLAKADLSGAYLHGAVITGANLEKAILCGVNLRWANLSGSDLSGCDLSGADLRKACLSRANLSGANLMYASLIETNCENAKFIGCSVYGISAWNLNLEGADQVDLAIVSSEGPSLTVDDLEVAQFIHLLLNNKKIRNIIETVTSKVVLILGRFTQDRKTVLDAIKNELRSRGYLPVMFDFNKPYSRNLTETLSMLAHMARFVIADITDAKSIAQELQRIVPTLPSLPVQPLLLASENQYGMFQDFRDYPWVLEPCRYLDLQDLLTRLNENVVEPAEAKAKEIEVRRKAFEETIGK